MLTYEQLEALTNQQRQALYAELSLEAQKGFGDGNQDALGDALAFESDDDDQYLAELALDNKMREMKLTVDEAKKSEYLKGYWYGQVLCG